MSEDFPDQPDIPDTFQLLDGGKAIKCLHCGRVSHHLVDIEERFCAECQVFHQDIWPGERKGWIKERG